MREPRSGNAALPIAASNAPPTPILARRPALSGSMAARGTAIRTPPSAAAALVSKTRPSTSSVAAALPSGTVPARVRCRLQRCAAQESAACVTAVSPCGAGSVARASTSSAAQRSVACASAGWAARTRPRAEMAVRRRAVVRAAPRARGALPEAVGKHFPQNR